MRPGASLSAALRALWVSVAALTGACVPQVTPQVETTKDNQRTSGVVEQTTASGETTTDLSPGEIAYTKHCAGCHGALATSPKRNRSAEQIQAAISTVAAMAQVSVTDVELSDIVRALADKPADPVASLKEKGQEAYGKYCQSCHGDLAKSTKLGIDYHRLSVALATITEMKALILSEEEKTAIILALKVEPASADETTGAVDRLAAGTTLYVNNCSSCHGALTNSSKRNRSATAINAALSSVPSMAGVNLTATDVDLVAFALSHGDVPLQNPPLSPPASEDPAAASPVPSTPESGLAQFDRGKNLYDANCSICHGAIIGTSKRNKSATDIDGAIMSVSYMNAVMLNGGEADDVAFALSHFRSEFTGESPALPVPTSPSPEPAPAPGPTPEPAPAPGPAPAPSPGPSTNESSLAQFDRGKILYDSKCSTCHGSLAGSSKRNKGAATINSALASINFMTSIVVTAGEVDDVAFALSHLRSEFTDGSSPSPGPSPSPEPSSSPAPAPAPGPAPAPAPGPAPSPSPSNPPTDLELFDLGASLYGAKCQACHGPVETSAKRNTTAPTVSGALMSQGAMSSITINNNEIDAVVFALSHDRSVLEGGGSTPAVTYRQAFDRKMPLQNREALTNRLTYLFATDSTNTVNATIAATITTNIWNQPAVLGGLCYQNLDPGCPGPTAFSSTTLRFGSAEAAMVAGTNTLRSGYLTKTCLSLIENSSAALKNALGKGGVLTTDSVTENRINALWKAFFPYLDASPEVVTAAYNEARQSTAATTEVWKDVMAVFCQSSLMERY